MDGHLAQTRLLGQNRRNGKTTKQIKSSAGPLGLQTPRDRTSSYQPQIVPKRQVVPDGIYYKVRHDGKVVTRVLYSVIGLNLPGKKQILGIYYGGE